MIERDHKAWALGYAARGWRVLPLRSIKSDGQCSCRRPSCRTPGKHPLIDEWQKRATTDSGQIEEWWSKWPAAGIGIATGNGLVVIDVDPRNGGSESLKAFDVPDTYTVRTGSGGLHLYFQAGGKVRNSAGTIANGIDLRGDGGFVVAPPTLHASGNHYEILKDLELAPLPPWALNGSGPARTPTPSRSKTHVELGEPREWPEVITEGSRNDFLTSEAGRLRSLGFDIDQIYAALQRINAARCSPPLPDEELVEIAKSMERYEPTYALNDIGNAYRFGVQQHDRVRYCAQHRSWYIWDGTRWQRDVTQQIVTLAIDSMRSIYVDAASERDKETRSEILKHGFKSETARGIKSALEMAEALPKIAIRADVLDRDPWLLNVENGTLNLNKDAERLRSHDPRDLITRKAPARYDPHATSSVWDAFLDAVTDGNANDIAYLQRAVGLSLTGINIDHVTFFVHGPTATGKSTFTTAIKGMLGDYAVQTAFETFLAKRWGGGASNDIADLEGARLILATEADRGRRFAEATLKQFTGGDAVRARQLWQNNREFTPVGKIWLCANDAPRSADDDDAMQRRLQIIEFKHAIPEPKRDRNLSQKLATPEVRRAILAWAVEGCLAWQRYGLKPPPSVEKATARYFKEQDPASGFWKECEFDPFARTPKSDVWTAYQAWARGEGIRFPLTQTQFNERVAKLDGVYEVKIHGHRFWKGLALSSGLSDAADPWKTGAS